MSLTFLVSPRLCIFLFSGLWKAMERGTHPPLKALLVARDTQ